MKKEIGILTAAAFALTSCGTMSFTSSSEQRFSDGLYSSPRVEDHQKILAAKAETDELVKKTRESEIYLSSESGEGHRTDTLYIPENKSAIINFSTAGTSVTITDDPFDQTYYSLYPWTYYRPVTFRSMYWDPWYYGRYRGYYDPWYWGGWSFYDPWYWGFGFAFDPWFYDPWFWGPAYRPWYPHYCGWYGGWGPGLGWHGPGHVHGGHGRDVYFGHRGSTGMRSPATASNPRHSYSQTVRKEGTVRTPVNRRGIGTSSSSARRASGSIGTAAGTRGSSFTSTSSAVRRTAAGNRTGIVSTDRLTSRPSAGSGSGTSSYLPATGARRSVQSYRGSGSSGTRSSVTSGQSSWRRPANSFTRSTSSFGNDPASTYYNNRSTSFRNSASGSGPAFNRNASSSSFNRSSSVSRQSSVSRSSSFSGSRSSGFSGGSRSSGGGSSSVRRR